MMKGFYGIAFDWTNIHIPIIIFCILLFGFKLLADRKNWKTGIFVWTFVAFLSLLVTNAVSSLF